MTEPVTHRLRGYRIDWQDADFPEILRGGPLTLREAKREVIVYFTRRRDAAREQMRRTRALRAEDIKAVGIND